MLESYEYSPVALVQRKMDNLTPRVIWICNSPSCYLQDEQGFSKPAVCPEAIASNDPTRILSGPDETLEMHCMVFAAERSRKSGTVVPAGG